MNESEWLVAVYEAIGDDVEEALSALGNTNPGLYHSWMERALRKAYLADYKSWKRRQVLTGMITDNQERLFTADEMKALEVRSTLVLVVDGQRTERTVFQLAGADGAEFILSVAARDERPARTTLERAKVLRKVAKLMVSKSDELGRPVSAAEVLGIGRAA